MPKDKIKESKKIIIISPNVSRTLGGISNTAYYLSKEFSLSYDTSIITSLPNNEKIEGINIFSPLKSNTYKSLFFQYRVLKKILKLSNNKNVIVFCMSWRCALAPYLLKKIRNIKYVILCHGNEVLNISTKANDKLENVVRRKIINNSEKLFANSVYTCNLVKKITNTIPIKIIHPCSGEKVSPKNLYQVPKENEKMILSIGRLEKRKGFQYVIIAVSKLVLKYPNIKYYIAGDGPFKQDLEELISIYGLKDNCILLGRISENEKKDYLSRCTVLTMPSFFDNSGSVEGFGIVFVEANAYGKPVIGTRSGGIPDAILNNITGILINEKSVDELVQAIESIISGEFKADVKKCFEWAEKHDYQRIADKYKEEINKLY